MVKHRIRRLQAAGGSASGRASLLDRVGGKVSGDGPELVNLEQDLRVLAKLRKDILSGKHPIYKPPPPGAAAAGLPERPRQPLRETALSLSDRITPNPAVDTQKEEQDFFNSIAQSLPADLSKSAVKRANDEAATHGEGDLAKRLRTDARDYSTHQNGAGSGPRGQDDHHTHAYSSSRMESTQSNDTSQAALEIEPPASRDGLLLLRTASSDAYRRRDRADSRGSTAAFAAKPYTTGENAPYSKASHPKQKNQQNRDGTDEPQKYDKFAKQRLPPAPIDTKSKLPSETTRDYAVDSRISSRPLDTARSRDVEPSLRASGDYRATESARPHIPVARQPSPIGTRYDGRDERRDRDGRRPSPPPPARMYPASDRQYPRATDERQASRQEPPYSGTRPVERPIYPDDRRPVARERSRSPPRLVAERSRAANADLPLSASRQRPPSPVYSARQRQASPPPVRVLSSNRPPSPPRADVRDSYRPIDRDYRREAEPARSGMYGQEVNDFRGQNNPRDRRISETGPARLAEGVAKHERTSSNLPAKPILPPTRKPNPESINVRNGHDPVNQASGPRTDPQSARVPSGEKVRGAPDARDVRDPRASQSAPGYRQANDDRLAYDRRAEVHLEGRPYGGASGYYDSRAQPPPSARPAEAAIDRRAPGRNGDYRDINSQDFRERGRESLPYSGQETSRQYPAPYDREREGRPPPPREDRNGTLLRTQYAAPHPHDRRRSLSPPPRNTRDLRPYQFEDDWDRGRAAPYDGRAVPPPPASARAAVVVRERPIAGSGPASYPYADLPDMRARGDERPASAR